MKSQPLKIAVLVDTTRVETNGPFAHQLEAIAGQLRTSGHAVTIGGSIFSESPDIYHLVHTGNTEWTTSRVAEIQRHRIPFVLSLLDGDSNHSDGQVGESEAHFLACRDFIDHGQPVGAVYDIDPPTTRRSIAPLSFSNALQGVVVSANAIHSGTPEIGRMARSLLATRGYCVHEFAFGSSNRDGVTRSTFLREYNTPPFVLVYGAINRSGHQLDTLKALINCELPVVVVGIQNHNDPEVIALLKRFRRAGPDLVLEALTSPLLASAIVASRVCVIGGDPVDGATVGFECGVLGRNVVTPDRSPFAQWGGTATFRYDMDDTVALEQAIIAAHYSPFRSASRELALQWQPASVATRLLAVYQSVLATTERDLVRSAPPVSTRYAGLSDPPVNPTATFKTLIVELGEMEIAERVDLSALLTAGDTAFAKGEIAEAERIYRTVLSHDLANGAAHRGVGVCALKRGDRELAYISLARSAWNDPINLNTIVELVGVAFELERYDDLAWVLGQYNGARPGNRDVLILLGETLKKLERTEAAAEYELLAHSLRRTG